MKWRDVKQGQTVRVKGENWTVEEREGETGVTLRHHLLGVKVGYPPPDAEVDVVPDPASAPVPREAEPQPEKTKEQLERYERALKRANPEPPSEELVQLREFAKSEGFRTSEVEGKSLQQVRELIHAKRVKLVAEENGVPEARVRDIQLRLTLGATVIADLHTSLPPQTMTVEVMDAQTMRNHLHFFHDTYPAEALDLDALVKVHAEAEEAERHEHSVPF